VPWDGGTTNRAGARHGPREIRNMSSFMRKVHHVSRIAPYDSGAHRRFRRRTGQSDRPDGYAGRIETFYAKVHAAGALPLSAGGDHLITLPIYRAIAKGKPIGMVHFDAHSDTNDRYFGDNRYTHGTPFRRAVEEGLLDPKRVVQIGIRGSIYSSDDMAFAESSGMRVIYMEEFTKLGPAKVIEIARRVMGDGPTYISFDVDGLDPVYAPGTGTPEIGGMSTREAQEVVRGLQGLNLVGGDVVEVSPPFDPVATRRWWAQPSCSRSCACWPIRLRASGGADGIIYFGALRTQSTGWFGYNILLAIWITRSSNNYAC
jgi:guanidinopropionase